MGSLALADQSGISKLKCRETTGSPGGKTCPVRGFISTFLVTEMKGSCLGCLWITVGIRIIIRILCLCSLFSLYRDQYCFISFTILAHYQKEVSYLAEPSLAVASSPRCGLTSHVKMEAGLSVE